MLEPTLRWKRSLRRRPLLDANWSHWQSCPSSSQASSTASPSPRTLTTNLLEWKTTSDVASDKMMRETGRSEWRTDAYNVKTSSHEGCPQFILRIHTILCRRVSELAAVYGVKENLDWRMGDVLGLHGWHTCSTLSYTSIQSYTSAPPTTRAVVDRTNWCSLILVTSFDMTHGRALISLVSSCSPSLSKNIVSNHLLFCLLSKNIIHLSSPCFHIFILIPWTQADIRLYVS